jgi:hypothetical protein
MIAALVVSNIGQERQPIRRRRQAAQEEPAAPNGGTEGDQAPS